MKFTFVQNFVYIMIICKRELKFIQKRGHTPCEGKVHRCLFEIFSWPEAMGHSIKLSTKHPLWKGPDQKHFHGEIMTIRSYARGCVPLLCTVRFT